MSTNNAAPTTSSAMQDEPLDREIRLAMTRGVHEPDKAFTNELMSVIAEEESVAVVYAAKPDRLPWALVALGFAFLVIAFIVPTSSAESTAISMTGSGLWTIGALGLISLLALTQSKSRFV